MTKETLTQWRKTDPNDQRVLNKQTNKQSFLKRTRGKIERANQHLKQQQEKGIRDRKS